MRLVPTGVLPGHHRSQIVSIALSPDGAHVVSGDHEGWLVVHVVGAQGSTETARLRVPPAGASSRPNIRCVVWPRHDCIVAHEYGAIRARRPADLVELASVAHLGAGPLAAGGHGAWVAALSDASATVLEVPTLSRRATHHVGGDFAYFTTTAIAGDPRGVHVYVSDDGGRDETAMGMLTRSGEPAIHVFDVNTSTAGHELARGDRVRAMHVDPWRDVLIVSCHGGELVRFTPTGPERSRAWGGDGVAAFAITERALVLSPDRPVGHGVLELWEPALGSRIDTVAIPGGLRPSVLAASPDGQLVITPARPEQGRFALQRWRIDA